MASGVAVKDEVVEEFQNIKLGHKYSHVRYRINDALTEIVVEGVVEQAGTSEDDYASFVNNLPKQECRYAVFDFNYETSEGGKRNKLVLIVWAPENAKIKQKMIYASSKDALKKKLVGIAYEVQATDVDELNWKDIIDKISQGGKN